MIGKKGLGAVLIGYGLGVGGYVGGLIPPSVMGIATGILALALGVALYMGYL